MSWIAYRFGLQESFKFKSDVIVAQQQTHFAKSLGSGMPFCNNRIQERVRLSSEINSSPVLQGSVTAGRRFLDDVMQTKVWLFRFYRIIYSDKLSEEPQQKENSIMWLRSEWEQIRSRRIAAK